MPSISERNPRNARWYDEPKDTVHTTLAAVFRSVRDESAWRLDADEYHAGLYCASDRPGVRGTSRRGYEYGPATLPHNVCRGAVDTLTAKIAKQRPLPQVLPTRGSWASQKRARKQTQFIDGEFYRQRVYEKHAPKIVRDALIFGRGVLKIYRQGDKIRTERVHPWELYADDQDGRYGLDELQNLYHVRSIDKAVLLERFGKTGAGNTKRSVAEAIDSSGRFAFAQQDWTGFAGTTDRVDVVEAWHLPSGPGAGDGRHVVIVDGATLLDEEWTYAYFPFAILGYSEAVVGCWPNGLVEQAEGYQYAINVASEKLTEQYRMSGVGVIVDTASGVSEQSIRNGITTLFVKPGTRDPHVFQMDLVNEHLRGRPRELTQDALNDIGLSQMSVQSQKPKGITAAIALQTLDDIETERFMIFGRAYEAWNLEVARRFLDLAKEIAEEFGDFAVSVPMKGGLVDLSWSDVYVEGAELKIQPTSLLPQSLAARLEKLKDLWNTGLLDRSAFLRHLEAPDLQAELDLETADQLVVDEMLERMSEAEESDGESAYMPPSAYQQLEDPTDAAKPGWALRRCQQRLNRGMLDGMPEFNMDMLRRFLADGDALLEKLRAKRRALAAVPAPSAAAPGIVPPAGAVAPPPALPDLGIPQSA